MGKPKKNPADYLLWAGNAVELNRNFYDAPPSDYFHQRLANLVTLATRPEALEPPPGEEVEIGRIKFRARPPETEEGAEKQRQRFLVTESQVLLHHLSETLLRLYLAHEGSPDCPWLEIARLKQPSEFRSQIKQRFEQPASSKRRRENLGDVFFGGATPATLTPPPEQAVWDQAIGVVERLMREFTDLHLNRNTVYNVAKHGFAVNAGNAAIQLEDASSGPFLRQEGDSISYLEEVQLSGIPRWQRTIIWVELDQTIILCYLACALIESLWSVARARFLGGSEVVTSLLMMASVPLDKVFSPTREPLNGLYVPQFGMQLLYEEDPRRKQAS